jgi:hypothetical protein
LKKACCTTNLYAFIAAYCCVYRSSELHCTGAALEPTHPPKGSLIFARAKISALGPHICQNPTTIPPGPKLLLGWQGVFVWEGSYLVGQSKHLQQMHYLARPGAQVISSRLAHQLPWKHVEAFLVLWARFADQAVWSTSHATI